MTDFTPPTPDLPQDWKQHAACRGMDASLFFPERGDTAPVRAAQAVCRTCPVAEECLSYAMALNEKFGIWGGTSERQRRAMRRTGTRRVVQQLTHGTNGGYIRHIALGTTPCESCRIAHNDNARLYKQRMADRRRLGGDAA